MYHVPKLVALALPGNNRQLTCAAAWQQLSPWLAQSDNKAITTKDEINTQQELLCTCARRPADGDAEMFRVSYAVQSLCARESVCASMCVRVGSCLILNAR
jgi:hypothetical protein